MRRAAGERGFALVLVLIVLLTVELIGVGALALATSNLHGAVANRLAMEAASVAEAGMNFGVMQLVSRASAIVPTDEGYAGEPGDVALPGPDGSVQGTFRVTVTCVYPQDAPPPDCRDDPAAPGIPTRDFRRVTSVGFVPGRPGRARRQIEATVRRYSPRDGDAPVYGVCGRDGVELNEGTTLTADVGSNGDIRVGGSAAIRRWRPLPPVDAPRVRGVTSTPGSAGLTSTYSWRVTFVDGEGRESGGGPPTLPVALHGESARLTEIPVGETSIVGRRIYRTRANAAATGPWYLAAELPNNLTREYVDRLPDERLGFRILETIGGNAAAGGAVECAGGCQDQIEGKVQAHMRDVMCPTFLPPPCQPGSGRAPGLFVQDSAEQVVHWGALRVDAGSILSILTPNDPRAQLHIHVTDIDLDRDAEVLITGHAAVYFHVSGTVHLAERAVFGVEDDNSSGTLMAPPDRVQILSCAQDPPYDPGGSQTDSVRLDQANRVSAFIFAPGANVVIDGPIALGGGIFGKYVRIGGASTANSGLLGARTFFRSRRSMGPLPGPRALARLYLRSNRSTGIVLDPSEGIASPDSGVRPSPFQYLIRWYDRPAIPSSGVSSPLRSRTSWWTPRGAHGTIARHAIVTRSRRGDIADRPGARTPGRGRLSEAENGEPGNTDA